MQRRNVVVRRGPSRETALVDFWSVPRDWDGQTAFMVCGGPTVDDQPVHLLAGRRVLAINRSHGKVPFADMLFFGDRRFWRDYGHEASAFAGQIVTTCTRVKDPRIRFLRRLPAHHLISKIPHSLVMDRTSTAAGLNLLMLKGVKRIVALGLDMQRGADGRSHHHEKYQYVVRDNCWTRQMAQLRLMAAPLADAGVEVFNASPRSLVDWWPSISFMETLTWD